jgi:tRNA dimethylallyltransferase
MNNLVAIVGPTGIGKSQLALHLAKLYNGEIVSADSRQVYRFMDIGTAKPSDEELASVPHHLISIINPDEEFHLAQYQNLALRAISDIQSRQRLPFLVGGSGLYVMALLEGWQIPVVTPDLELRNELKKRADAGGADELYQELVRIDPAAAKKIDGRNVRRVIRALEVQKKMEKPFSEVVQKKDPGFNSLIIGLTAEREELYRITDLRVDRMIERGLVHEVENLLKLGYDINLPAMSGIGYKQITQYLKGEMPLNSAVQKIKTETHRFVRHQYAWFRLEDARIRWFDIRRHKYTDIEKELTKFTGQ